MIVNACAIEATLVLFVYIYNDNVYYWINWMDGFRIECDRLLSCYLLKTNETSCNRQTPYILIKFQRYNIRSIVQVKPLYIVYTNKYHIIISFKLKIKSLFSLHTSSLSLRIWYRFTSLFKMFFFFVTKQIHLLCHYDVHHV